MTRQGINNSGDGLDGLLRWRNTSPWAVEPPSTESSAVPPEVATPLVAVPVAAVLLLDLALVDRSDRAGSWLAVPGRHAWSTINSHGTAASRKQDAPGDNRSARRDLAVVCGAAGWSRVAAGSRRLWTVPRGTRLLPSASHRYASVQSGVRRCVRGSTGPSVPKAVCTGADSWDFERAGIRHACKSACGSDQA